MNSDAAHPGAILFIIAFVLLVLQTDTSKNRDRITLWCFSLAGAIALLIFALVVYSLRTSHIYTR